MDNKEKKRNKQENIAESNKEFVNSTLQTSSLDIQTNEHRNFRRLV